MDVGWREIWIKGYRFWNGFDDPPWFPLRSLWVLCMDISWKVLFAGLLLAAMAQHSPFPSHNCIFQGVDRRPYPREVSSPTSCRCEWDPALLVVDVVVFGNYLKVQARRYSYCQDHVIAPAHTGMFDWIYCPTRPSQSLPSKRLS
jgi:hypothetical protein